MKTSDMPVMRLHGSARERGHAHGETLRTQIETLVGNVKEAVGHKCGLSPDAYFSEMFHAFQFWRPLDLVDPEFLEEIEAIASAAGQRTEDIAALNLLDEEIWYGRARLMQSPSADAALGGYATTDKCSVIAAADRDRTLLGQNMDIATWTDGTQVLLHVSPAGTDVSYFAFSCAGILGLCGVNDRGLGVCVNNLMHLDPAPQGRPVLSSVRSLLLSTDIDAARRVLETTSHASGQCFTLGQRGRLVGLECSGSQCVEYSNWPTINRRVHTNHALVNTDTALVDGLRERGKELRLPRFFFDVTRDSLARQMQLESEIGDDSRPANVDLLRAALAKTSGTYPVCRTGETSSSSRNVAFTTGSVIWELGADVRAYIAAGPPDRTEYLEFRF